MDGQPLPDCHVLEAIVSARDLLGEQPRRRFRQCWSFHPAGGSQFLAKRRFGNLVLSKPPPLGMNCASGPDGPVASGKGVWIRVGHEKRSNDRRSPKI
jgi:hypothetical protein